MPALPFSRNWEGEVWQNLLNTRLNWEKLVKPQCAVMSAIFISVYSKSCWALRTRVIWM